MKLLHMLRQALRGDRLTQAAVMMLIVLFLCSLLSPLLPIGRPDQVGYGPRLGAPEWSVPFGTDQLGRSVLARVLQGLGTSATRVIATSIVRDCYAGRRMASVMSLAMMVFIAVPVIAPSL